LAAGGASVAVLFSACLCSFAAFLADLILENTDMLVARYAGCTGISGMFRSWEKSVKGTWVAVGEKVIYVDACGFQDV